MMLKIECEWSTPETCIDRETPQIASSLTVKVQGLVYSILLNKLYTTHHQVFQHLANYTDISLHDWGLWDIFTNRKLPNPLFYNIPISQDWWSFNTQNPNPTEFMETGKNEERLDPSTGKRIPAKIWTVLEVGQGHNTKAPPPSLCVHLFRGK